MKKLSRRLKKLPIALAALFAIPAAPVIAASHTVGNCDDDGPGSLRSVIGALTNAANSGDTINMTGLGCGTISLSTGGIAIPIDDLTLTGPGAGQLTIERKDGSGKQRIFRHTGTGTLALAYLTVSNGYYGGAGQDTVLGGCIFSNYGVYLDHARVTNCTVAAHNAAAGGGVFAGTLKMRHSTLSGNTAKVEADATTGALGGGGFAGYVTIAQSTISSNASVGTFLAHGGGLSAPEGSITNSTVDDNQADGRGGGISVEKHCVSLCIATTLTLSNSTISGNDAFIAGGIYDFFDYISLNNSTVAFNTATSGSGFFGPNPAYFGAGIFAYDGTVHLESTLIANNSYGSPPIDNDFSVYPASALVTGANNLVREGNGDAPPGSMHGSCPRLGPLRDNGGPTLTHALLSGSPAINAGDNSTGNYLYDQRLSPYIRENGSADIGAVERQPEQIFDTSFEGCIALR